MDESAVVTSVSGKKLLVANWQMNGLSNDLENIRKLSEEAAKMTSLHLALCLPATLIERACRVGRNITIGGQDVHESAAGAHTGCISARMLVDAGASLVLVGHSGHRSSRPEAGSLNRSKTQAALNAGLTTVVVVRDGSQPLFGSALTQRLFDQVKDLLPAQIAHPGKLVVAYAPASNVPMQRLPALPHVVAVHAVIRQCLVHMFGYAGLAVRVLYAGPLAANCSGFIAHSLVDGLLLDLPSTSPFAFLQIAKAAQRICAPTAIREPWMPDD
jgi:triosephosphate isomerase